MVAGGADDMASLTQKGVMLNALNTTIEMISCGPQYTMDN